jgi:hypothetical protein
MRARVEEAEDAEYPILIDGGEGHGLQLREEDAIIVNIRLREILQRRIAERLRIA